MTDRRPTSEHDNGALLPLERGECALLLVPPSLKPPPIIQLTKPHCSFALFYAFCSIFVIPVGSIRPYVGSGVAYLGSNRPYTRVY